MGRPGESLRHARRHLPLQSSGEWLHGRFHVLFKWDYAATSPTGAYQELSIFGYEAEKKQQVLFDFDSFGTTATFRGDVKGKVWTYTLELSLEGKPAWHRFTVTEVTPKQCSWVNEYSRDRKAWTLFGEGRMAKP